jgi:hypothetical protein
MADGFTRMQAELLLSQLGPPLASDHRPPEDRDEAVAVAHASGYAGRCFCLWISHLLLLEGLP